MIQAAWLLRIIPTAWKWGALAVVLIALAGVYLAHRNAIYQDGFRAAQEACERERKAQEEANNAAIREAEQRLKRAADELSIKSQELNNALQAIDEASAADPDGGLECLSADSVRRLNSLGPRPNPAP